MIHRSLKHVPKTTNLRDEIVIGSRTYKLGQTIRVKNERGNFQIMEIRDDDAVSVYGGTKNREKWRTFPFELIK